MNEKLNEFNNKLRMKRVAIRGAGVSNVPLFEYLYNLDSKIYLFDKKNYDELDDNVKHSITKYNISTSLG